MRVVLIQGTFPCPGCGEKLKRVLSIGNERRIVSGHDEALSYFLGKEEPPFLNDFLPVNMLNPHRKLDQIKGESDKKEFMEDMEELAKNWKYETISNHDKMHERFKEGSLTVHSHGDPNKNGPRKKPNLNEHIGTRLEDMLPEYAKTVFPKNISVGTPTSIPIPYDRMKISKSNSREEQDLKPIVGQVIEMEIDWTPLYCSSCKKFYNQQDVENSQE